MVTPLSKFLNPPHSQAHRFGNRQDAPSPANDPDDRCRPPSFGIWIRAAAEARKQVEFQMVVAIDQAGQNQMAVEIQFGLVGFGTSQGLNAAALDLRDRCVRWTLRPALLVRPLIS